MKSVSEKGPLGSIDRGRHVPRADRPRATSGACLVCGFAAGDASDDLPGALSEVERCLAGWLPARGLCRQCALMFEPVAIGLLDVR
jgi:hypothetical protein